VYVWFSYTKVGPLNKEEAKHSIYIHKRFMLIYIEVKGHFTCTVHCIVLKIQCINRLNPFKQ